MKRAWQTAAIVLAIATVQGGAVLVYRWVERGRETRTNSTPFVVERLVRRPAPDLTLAAADGSRRRLSDYRGRPILLHFWATWCPPCKAELPELLALGRELEREGGPRVVAVTTEPDWDRVAHFFGGAIPPEVARAEAGDAERAFEISVLPDTYLVGADGRLLQRFGGARNWSSDAARALLRDSTRAEHDR